MYGGDGAGSYEPDAKKQRLDQETHRVRRDTFVESMLFSVANTLAGDAEYGYNTANQIRRRVEDITEQIDDRSDDALRSSSRAVLESRFALGLDDGQYLSQAVSLLWAGDGGERLRIAPLNSMPEIMRIASAKGMVQAMGGVVKRQKNNALVAIKRALRLAAWLMQIKVVRVAILDILENGLEDDAEGQKFFKEVHGIISDAFSSGGSLAEGSNAVLALMNGSNGMQHARAIVLAFSVLMQPSSTPNAIFKSLVTAMNATVLRTERDVAKLFNVADAMGGAAGRVMDSSRNQKGVDYSDPSVPDAPGKRDNVCEMRNNYDNQSGMNELYTYNEFCTAVNEAVSRISGNNKSIDTTHSNVITHAQLMPLSAAASSTDAAAEAIPRTTGSAGPGMESNKGWFVDSVVSPMWNHVDHRAWQTVLGVGDSVAVPVPGTAAGSSQSTRIPDAEASRDMYRVVRTANQNRLAFDGNINDLASDLLDGKMNQDEAFVQYAMMRGLCGHRGVHQEKNGATDEVVEYDYPTDDLKEYKKGEFVEQPEAKLSDGTLKQVYAVDEDVYSTERMMLDTDFFGNATKDRAVKSNTLGDGTVTTEEARKARWLPTNASNPGQPFAFDTYSQLVCEASVYEFMSLSLSSPSKESVEKCSRSMRGAAAVAKLRQLECMAFVKSNRPDNDMLHGPAKMGSDVYVTRPCVNCGRSEEQEFSHADIGMPVDAGIARIRPIGSAPDTVRINTPPPSTLPEYKFKDPYYMSFTTGNGMPHNSLSVILSDGMEVGWNPIGTPQEQQSQTMTGAEATRPFSLFMGPSADAQPVTDAPLGSYALDTSNYNKMLPDDLHVVSMFNAFGGALEAIDRFEQIECEEQYVERFKVDGSEEQQRVFGLQRSVEDATRDRRADLWTDALREVAISGDRLYRFVTELTGAIGEAADSAISWEDEDLKALAKEAATKQKAMADRVSRFQTKLVESVVSSTLRASKLQLDVRDRGDAANELVVVNTEVKEGIRQITSGEAGHGFFEASVELGNLIGTVSKPITIKDLVNRLRHVSMEFQDQLQSSMAVSTPMSYSRISEPRNSFMMHLKPDTVAAIHKAFDLITSELRACPGFHRHVYLWEYVEGKDWVLSSRFAELVGLMLQNTRMRSGSFAAYVGTAQIITNTQNVRMQIQRLKTQVCSYLASQDTPQFLSPSGRTLYFGGTMKNMSTPKQLATSAKVKKSVLGKEGGFYDEFWGSVPNPEQQGPTEALMRRIKDLVSKIENGKVSPDIVASSAGYGLDMVSQPLLRRRYFTGATQAQIMSSATRVIQEEATFDPPTLKTMMRASVQDELSSGSIRPAAERVAQIDPVDPDWCQQKFKGEGRYDWIVAICRQLDKSPDYKSNKYDVQNRYFEDAPKDTKESHEPAKRRQQYYVVQFQITAEMLKNAGVERDVLNWKSSKGVHLKGVVNVALKKLFANDLKETGRNWVPHSQWFNTGDKTKGVANTWLLEVHPDDEFWRKCYNKALKIKTYTGIALGIPFTIPRAGMSAVNRNRTAILAGSGVIAGAQMLAGLVGPNPAMQMTSEVISSSYASSSVSPTMQAMGARFPEWAPTMARVSRRFMAGGKASSDLFYAGGAWAGSYAGAAFDKLIMKGERGQRALAELFRDDIELEESSNQGTIDRLESLGEKRTEYQDRQLTSARAFKQVILNAKPAINKLLAAGDDEVSFNLVLDFDANFGAWRKHSRTLEDIERVVADVVENPSMVELANTMGETIECAVSLSESCGEAIAAAATMSPAKLSESFGLGLDVFKERQTSAQKYVAETMGANMRRLVEQARNTGKDGDQTSLLAPIDLTQADLAKTRDDIKNLAPKQVAQELRKIYGSKVNAIQRPELAGGLGGEADASMARDVSFLAMMIDILEDVSDRRNGMRKLNRDRQSEWSLPEQLAVRAFLQWEPGRITKFQEILAPTMAEVVMNAKEEAMTISEYFDRKRGDLIDIINKNPLVDGDIELAVKAAEYLASPLYTMKDSVGNVGGIFSKATTTPRGNYVKFMSLLLGTSVQRIAKTQKIDSVYWDEYKARFEQSGVDGVVTKGVIPAFVVRKGAAATFDDIEWINHIDGLMRSKTAAAKQWASDAAASTSESTSGYFSQGYDVASYVSDLTQTAAFGTAGMVYRNGAYYWDATFAKPPPPTAPGPSAPPPERPPTPPPPLEEDEEMPAAAGVPPEGDFAIEEVDE